MSQATINGLMELTIILSIAVSSLALFVWSEKHSSKKRMAKF